jgi:hypothetical protein
VIVTKEGESFTWGMNTQASEMNIGGWMSWLCKAGMLSVGQRKFGHAAKY